MHILSIDIGGTKSEAVLYDEQGNVLKTTCTGSCHPLNVAKEVIVQRLQECNIDKDAHIVLGYAGYARNKQLQQIIQEVVQQAYPNRYVTILSDIEMASLGTLEGQDGITVILGTGSVLLQRKNQKLTCVGGWGYLLGDEGSGYSLGLSVIKEFVKQVDGRHPKDALYQAVRDTLQLEEDHDIISIVMNDGKVNRTLIASLSKIITTLDIPSCKQLLQQAVNEVVELICSIASKEDRIVLTGGLIHSDIYMQQILDALQPTYHISIAKHEPVYGGYIYHIFNK